METETINEYWPPEDLLLGSGLFSRVEVDKIMLDCPGLRVSAERLHSIPGISPSDAAWILPEIGKKWNFLLDPQAPIVEEAEISLDFYQEKFLGAALNHLSANSKLTKDMVPTTAVAVFDAYPNKYNRQAMEWAHEQASKIVRKLAVLT